MTQFIKKFKFLLFGALLASLILAIISQVIFWKVNFSLMAILNLVLLASNSQTVYFSQRSESFRWLIFWIGLKVACLSWGLFLIVITMLIFQSTALLISYGWLLLANCLIMTITSLYYGVVITNFK